MEMTLLQMSIDIDFIGVLWTPIFTLPNENRLTKDIIVGVRVFAN